MEWSRRQGRIAAGAVLAAVAALAFARLSAFGIWDPWELSSADLARQLATGEAASLDRPPLTLWLVAQGFSLFGIHEWSGRLPMALAGLLAVGFAYVLVARFAGRRAGVWAAVVAGTTPLFLLNARQMLGAAPGFAASAAVFTCALAAVFSPARLRAPAGRRDLRRGLWFVGLLASAALSTLASGVLLGVAPPLLAVGAAILARGELTPPVADRKRAAAAAAVLGLALLAGLGAAHAVWADYAGFGWWTGGVARGGDPPTWEVAVERVFHAFAPWSALLPLALARMLMGAPQPERAEGALVGRLAAAPAQPLARHPEENALRLALVAWVAFGYVAQTVYTARFGPATFLPLVGAAAAVGLMLHDVERTRRAWWGTAVVAFLFVGLLVRDFRAYPSGPIEGLPAEGIEVPEVFDPARSWAAVLGLFALLLGFGLAADPAGAHRGLRRIFRSIAEGWRAGGGARVLALSKGLLRIGVPVALIAEQWRRGGGFRVWLAIFGLVLAVITGFGVAVWVAPEALAGSLGMTSLAIRVGRLLVLLLPLLAVAVALGRLGLFLFAKLGSYRLVPAGVAALAVAAYTSLGFQPELSSHFSPREVYDTYNELAGAGEPLGEYRVGGRAAAYYATGEILELGSQGALIDFLQRDERVWAAFRADDLASIDRAYRRAEGRHLFVADARSARMLLATNRPVEGVENQNYLADAVLDEAPEPQHRVHVSFDDRIHLLGYDLGLPHGSYVGPGESFTITWYFRVEAPVSGSYQPFVHIDGPGQRINGDHEPVDGRYPVRLWEPGDIVVDRHELRVPANYRRGNLTIYMGFYAGDQRLEVKEGPSDDENRARVGVLPIR
jgi:4-amino-4-deoxy-L-arabinose transferase-like glycosyltransferase